MVFINHLNRNLIFTLFVLLALPTTALSGESSWNRIETKHAIIRYASQQDLGKFDANIDYSPGEWGLKRLFSSSDSGGQVDHLKKKIDALYERAQEILQMRGKLKKVFINLYPDREALGQAYYRLTKRQCRIRAWYVHRLKTIYINVEDVHEGMLAHEMAHSIIDHYLMVPPPSASAEILARYVDKNLHY
jgi:hypothetical protein